METQKKKNTRPEDEIRALQDSIKSLEKKLDDQKQIQDSLMMSEKNLTAILEQNPDGIIIVDMEGVVLYVNPATEKLFNKSKKEFLGSLFGFPVTIDKNESTLVIISGKVLREVEFRVVRVMWQGKPAFQLSVRDITKQKQTEQELKQSNEKFKSITENSADAIFITDPFGKFVYTNHAAVKLVGFTRKAFSSKTFFDLTPQNKQEEMLKLFRTLQLKGKIFTAFELLKKKGTTVAVDLNAVMLPEGLIYVSCRDISKRIRAEKKVHNLARFPSENPNPVIRMDENGVILFTNKAGKSLLKDWGCTVGDTAPDIFYSKVFNASSPEQDKIFEVIHNHRYYTFSVARIVNEGYINLYGIDISDLKKTKEELSREQYLMNTLLANIPDFIYFKDLKSRFIRINKALADLIGLADPKEAQGKSDEDFFSSDFNRQAFKDEQQIIKTGQPVINKEELNTGRNKTELWVSTTKMPLRDMQDNIIGTFGISRDITTIKQTEEQLKQAKVKAEESEAKFIELYSSVSEAIFAYDPDSYKILEANKATSDIYGYSHDELIGMSCIKFSAEPEKSVAVAASIKNAEKINIKERHHKKKDGTAIFVEVNNYNILVNGKHIIYAVCHDITDIKKKENELIFAKEKAEENNRLKTAFLHNISHEIRTPMNAIMGFSGFLNDPGLTPENRKQYTDIIINGCEQLVGIIDDIISIASIEAGQEKMKKDEVNINAILQYVYDEFSLKSKEKKITLGLTTTLSDEDSVIITDKTKLAQILTNLVGNALKFTRQGYIHMGYAVKGRQLEFYVKDSGIGIPLEMHEEIFVRFRQVETTDTRKFGGSGLGLSISKAYVELLGGKIWLTSEMQKGSTFYFTLPYKKVKPKKLPDVLTKNVLTIDLKKLNTLLIAEDEDANYWLLEKIFSGFNVQLIRALNGLEAVEICRTKAVDLVLMDIKMPKMDGYEATKRIKAMKPNLKIIAQTAYSTDADKRKAYTCGVSDFISKPIKPAHLISKINQHLP